MVSRRGEHVDDRPSHADLTAVLDLMLAAVSRLHERGDELVAVAPFARPHLDRLDLVDVGAESLHQRADGGDDDVGRPCRFEQAPDGPQAATHRLDARADALERKGLPRGEQVDVIRSEIRAEVVDQALGVGRRRDRDDVRTAVRGGDETGDRERASRLGDGDERGRPSPNCEQGGVVANQCRQFTNAHLRTTNPTGHPSSFRRALAYILCGQRTPKRHGR